MLIYVKLPPLPVILSRLSRPCLDMGGGVDTCVSFLFRGQQPPSVFSEARSYHYLHDAVSNRVLDTPDNWSRDALDLS